MGARAHRAFPIALALLLGACEREVELSVTFPPRGADVRSVVVVFEGDGEPRIEAYAARSGLKIEANGYTRLSVLHYAEALSALEMSEGVVPRAEPIECGATALPDSYTAAFTRALVTGAELEAIDALPPSLVELRYKGSCPCVEFREISKPAIDTRLVNDWLTMADGSVVLATSGGLRRVSYDGTVTAATATVRSYTGIHRAPDDELWLSAGDGHLLHGTIEGGFADTGTVAPEIFAMDGQRDGAPFELFTVHADDQIRRYDGGDWELLFDLPGSDSHQAADVAWLDRGQMIALQNSGRGPVHYDRSSARRVALDDWDLVQGAPASVDFVAGLGIFLGSRTFNIYRYEESAERWSILDTNLQNQGSVRDFYPFHGGFLYTGQDSRFGQYHPRQGFCFDLNLEGDRLLRHLIPLGEDRVLLAGDRDSDNFMFLMERVR